MTTSIILHVGNDICHRIPIMRAASFAVVQSEDSVIAILRAFANGDSFSAITFHADISAPSSSVVWAARKLSAAPVVLFDNPSINHDRSCFDVVIPNLTYPSRWLKDLHDGMKQLANYANAPVEFYGNAGKPYLPFKQLSP